MAIIQTDKPLAPRRDHDFYPTPSLFCERALSLLPSFLSEQPLRILDPGCGTGVWGQAAKRRWPHAVIDGVEIRDVDTPQGYRTMYRGDFRLQDTGMDYHLIIGNPPFKYAEAFVRVGMANLIQNGHMLFLLPLQFLESEGRRVGLFREYPPREVHVAGRISFSGNGKVDNTAFAVYIWQQGWNGTPSLKWMQQGKLK